MYVCMGVGAVLETFRSVLDTYIVMYTATSDNRQTDGQSSITLAAHACIKSGHSGNLVNPFMCVTN